MRPRHVPRRTRTLGKRPPSAPQLPQSIADAACPNVDFVHCACAQQLPPVTNDNTIRLDLNDAVVTARESREAPGQTGNNCGYKNTELFGAGWNNLHVVAANAALEYIAFAERYAAHSNRYCKRKRGEQSKPTAQDVAAYHRKGGWATNLTMALLAKGLRCDLYVATRDGQQRTMVTLYSADATLDGDAPLGQGLTSQEEVQPLTLCSLGCFLRHA